MTRCRPIDTSMDPNVKLLSGQGEPLSNPKRYRRLVEKLNYLTVTRHDISFPISLVSQFMTSPYDTNWEVDVRILLYIKSAPGKGLLFKDQSHEHIIGYTNTDCADHPLTGVRLSDMCFNRRLFGVVEE